MILLQLILVSAVALIILVSVKNRRSQRTQAFKKLTFLAVGVTAIIAILQPDWVQWVAQFVGVGRGTDLVLYLTVVALLFVSLDLYTHLQDAEDKISELARAVTLAAGARNPAEAGSATPAHVPDESDGPTDSL